MMTLATLYVFIALRLGRIISSTYRKGDSMKSSSHSLGTFKGRMSPKYILFPAVIYFVLVHSGETFTRPRPQALEFSKAFGFISALKAMFGLDREKNEIYEKLEPLRKKMSCARLARDLNKRWIEWYCLKGMPNKKPSN